MPDSRPRSVRRADGSVVAIRETPGDLEGGKIEEFHVPAWVAESIRAQENRCFCMNPCAGGCKNPRISICALCLNGMHDPNSTRDFVESRSGT